MKLRQLSTSFWALDTSFERPAALTWAIYDFIDSWKLSQLFWAGFDKLAPLFPQSQILGVMAEQKQGGAENFIVGREVPYVIEIVYMIYYNHKNIMWIV